jgi:hypothetical protein
LVFSTSASGTGSASMKNLARDDLLEQVREGGGLVQRGWPAVPAAGRRRILDEASAAWSEHDRAELARLTRCFAGDIFTLVESLDPRPP